MSVRTPQYRSGPAAPAPSPVASRYSSRDLQRLVDRAACFHLFLSPGGGGTGAVHRFDIEMAPARKGTGVRANNSLGEQLGQSECRCSIIPNSYSARPDREPPTSALNPS